VAGVRVRRAIVWSRLWSIGVSCFGCGAWVVGFGAEVEIRSARHSAKRGGVGRWLNAQLYVAARR
jgi:hypothetical protein